jgi:two-component system, NarL family, nitrate/nitrite response regulator NarL
VEMDTARTAAAETRLDAAAAHSNAHDNRIGVVLIGGDLLFREGLKSVLRNGPCIVLGEADSIQGITNSSLETRQPSVVIAMRTDQSPRDYEEWCASIRSIWAKARLLALADREDNAALFDALHAGADGCLYRNTSPDAFVQAIKVVSMGQNIFPTQIGHSFLGPAARKRPNVTPRESDILRALLQGYSNKVIANKLGTTDMTVKAQMRHLLRKLGVANRTQAALWAREFGFNKDVEPDALGFEREH